MPPRRVIVTRPAAEARAWVDGLVQAGFKPEPLPLIEISPVADSTALSQAWARLGDYRAVMFVSGNAASHFFMPNRALAHDLPWLSAINLRAWATGPGTVRALLKAGLSAADIDAPPPNAAQFDSEALWAVVRGQVTPGGKFLIVRGASPALGLPGDVAESAPAEEAGLGRDWLASQIQRAGAQVDFCVAYQRSAPQWSAQQAVQAHAWAGSDAIWLLSSSEAVANLGACLPGQSWAKARAVATHSRIAQSARALGFGVVCESRPELASVLASIESMG